MNLAVIPARGGSVRLPRKNVRTFAGRPMLVWPLRTVVESGYFDRVLVSTDDEEIASIAVSYGAEVPFLRPRWLADDHTGTREVLRHAVAWWHQNVGPSGCVRCPWLERGRRLCRYGLSVFASDRTCTAYRRSGGPSSGAAEPKAHAHAGSAAGLLRRGAALSLAV